MGDFFAFLFKFKCVERHDDAVELTVHGFELLFDAVVAGGTRSRVGALFKRTFGTTAERLLATLKAVTAQDRLAAVGAEWNRAGGIALRTSSLKRGFIAKVATSAIPRLFPTKTAAKFLAAGITIALGCIHSESAQDTRKLAFCQAFEVPVKG